MKKMILFTAIGFAALMTGCSKVKQLANINFDVPDSVQVSVPQVQGYPGGTALPAGGLDLPSISTSVATNSKTYVSQYGTAVNLITNVYLKSFVIKIVSPPDQNFNFLDKVDIYISANNLPEVLVASDNNIPKGTNTLNLTTNTSANLKDYFLQDTIFIRMAAHVNTIPPSGEVLDINAIFHVVANPLN